MRTRLVLLLALAALLALAPSTPVQAKLKARFQAVTVPVDVSLWGVEAFEDGRVAVCGVEGTFLSSDDGKTWKTRQLDEDASLKLMYWLDKQTGFVAGRRGKKNVMFFTKNGGRDFVWRSVDLPYPITGITFLNSHRGWLVGGSRKDRDGAWRTTTDGGVLWKEATDGDFKYPARVLNAVCAPGAEQIWAVGSGVLISLVGEAANTPLYKARGGAILHSRNKGSTWEVQDAGNARDVQLTAVDFVNDEIGCVVGDGGFLAMTANGGKIWKKLDVGTESDLLAVEVVTKDMVVAVGKRGAAVGTNDGGKTFAKIETETKVDLRDCSFADEKTGYAVGRSGTVLKFTKVF